MRSERLSADDYASLASDEETFRAYDRIVDEAYRFHQFWGGMALALPLLAAGIAVGGTGLAGPEKLATVAGFAVMEVGAVWGAVACYRRYLFRVKRVLEG